MEKSQKFFFKMVWDGHCLEIGHRTLVMGILNVTPDSFSDGGNFYTYNSAIAQGEKLCEEGADILDIGGESTRPFSQEVSEEEEMRRVLPIVENLAKRVSVPLSIDTTKAGVAKRALDAGASIINDIGALRLDPSLADLAVQRKVPIILMHMKGLPGNMQVNPHYDNLIEELNEFFAERIEFAINKGIERSKIIIDPGIGFGKNIDHNLQIIGNISKFNHLNFPILIGPSRKAFIRNILKEHFKKEFPADSIEVETGTQAVISASILNGAHIVRVHDVASTVSTIKLINAIQAEGLHDRPTFR
jgi:dihydropteroate synthase